jgi:transposase
MAIGHMRRRDKAPRVFEQGSSLAVLKEFLGGLHGTIVLTFEETTTAQWLYVELRDEVTRIIVCNPYTNRLLSDGPKTDKIDARKLCMLLRAGLLKEVFHSSDELYDLRLLVSGYRDLVQAGVRALNQRSALSRGHADRVKHTTFILDHLNKSIDLYQLSKAEYEAKFERFCRRNKQLKRLLPISGIGTIGAVMILATVVDARRFPRAGNYHSYCGLVKLEKSSGGRSYGRRKPQYSRTLKAVYKIAALAAIRGKNPTREYYDELLARGVAEHHARHHIARYIATVTYGVLKTGTVYNPYQWRQYTQVA